MTKQDKQKLIEEVVKCRDDAPPEAVRSVWDEGVSHGLDVAIRIIQNYEPRDEEKAD